MNTITENGKIFATKLGVDNGILTYYLDIRFQGVGCAFGGYTLDEYDKSAGKRIGTAAGMQSIAEILECVGVAKWEDLKGSYVRAEHEGIGGRILRIGNLIEDKWFSPDEFFRRYRLEGK